MYGVLFLEETGGIVGGQPHNFRRSTHSQGQIIWQTAEMEEGSSKGRIAKNGSGSVTMLGQEVNSQMNCVYSLRLLMVIYMRE